jgi:tetratricopeptide (TPR) repeat protein
MAIEGAATFAAPYARAMSGLAMLAYRQADFTEAERRFQTSLDLERGLNHQAGVANALGDLGNIANQNGEFMRARDLYQQALAIEEGLPVDEGGHDSRLIAVTRFNLGVVELGQGRYVEAEALLQESFASFTAAGNSRDSAFPLHVLGQLCIATGRLEAGRNFAEQSLAIREGLTDQKGIADAHRTLAWAAVESGEIDKAREHLITSLTGANGIGDNRGLSETLEIMGLLFARVGRNADAVTVFWASDLRRAGKTYSLPPVRAARRDAGLIKASCVIGAEEDAKARQRGAAMKFPEAVETLLAMLRQT